MATRRNPLLPPPPRAPEPATSHGAKPAGTSTSPPERGYRGKSSGEFQRVVAGRPSDVGALVAEAEQCMATLTLDDNHRRLLQLAVLRRDTALLSGLLEVVRQRR